MKKIHKINYIIGMLIFVFIVLSFLTFKENTFNVFLGSIYKYDLQSSSEKTNRQKENKVLNQDNNLESSKSSEEIKTGGKISYEDQVKMAKSLPFSKGKIEEALGAENKFRAFDVKITKDGFYPNTIVIKTGDVAQFNFISDFDTDLESKDLKFFSFIQKGKMLNFSVITKYSGTYTFYCLNMCPNGERFFGILEVRD